jgi:hypothetical protein
MCMGANSEGMFASTERQVSQTGRFVLHKSKEARS